MVTGRGTADKPGGRPVTKGEQTRQAVLAAAIERFGRDGYRPTSVADVARAADVGPTVPYAYFSSKEALFLAALDEDAAATIQEGVASILDPDGTVAWRDTLLPTLVSALDRHPLARRVLSGLEPPVTDRVMDLPALAELRKALTELLRTDQVSGRVRTDIDPAQIANGAVALTLAALMAVLQFGDQAIDRFGADVLAFFDAAISPPRR